MDKNKVILGGVIIVAIVAGFIIYKKNTKKANQQPNNSGSHLPNTNTPTNTNISTNTNNPTNTNNNQSSSLASQTAEKNKLIDDLIAYLKSPSVGYQKNQLDTLTYSLKNQMSLQEIKDVKQYFDMTAAGFYAQQIPQDLMNSIMTIGSKYHIMGHE